MDQNGEYKSPSFLLWIMVILAFLACVGANNKTDKVNKQIDELQKRVEQLEKR